MEAMTRTFSFTCSRDETIPHSINRMQPAWESVVEGGEGGGRRTNRQDTQTTSTITTGFIHAEELRRQRGARFQESDSHREESSPPSGPQWPPAGRQPCNQLAVLSSCGCQLDGRLIGDTTTLLADPAELHFCLRGYLQPVTQ